MTFSNQQNKTSPLDIIKQLMPTPGMGARLLCVLLTIITLMSALVAESHPWLMIHRSTIQNTQFTSLFTNTFVARPSGFFNLLIFIALGVYFFKDLFALWWRRDRAPLVVAIVGPLLAVFVVELILGGGRGWGLTTSLLVTLWFAIPVEREWGSRRLVIFCVVVVIMVLVAVVVVVIVVELHPSGSGSKYGEGGSGGGRCCGAGGHAYVFYAARDYEILRVSTP